MTNFIQKPLPIGSVAGNDLSEKGQPGALGAGQRASTGLVTFNRFWAYFVPLFGGWIADTKWGRFKTIQVSIAMAMFGHIIIIISAIPSVISNPNGALGCFAVGLIFFGIGVGGFKPNISPLMAEQLTAKPMHVEQLKSGERVIVDPALTTQRMFMCTRLKPPPPRRFRADTRQTSTCSSTSAPSSARSPWFMPSDTSASGCPSRCRPSCLPSARWSS